MPNYNAWWSIPDHDETYWFNDAAERATIKSIVDGTSHARSWSDIQSTWHHSGPVHRIPIIRVERFAKAPKHRPSIHRAVTILMANGMSRHEAKLTARGLLYD